MKIICANEDLKVVSVRPQRWEDCRNLACALGGPNPALPPAAPYSEAHYKVCSPMARRRPGDGRKSPLS